MKNTTFAWKIPSPFFDDTLKLYYSNGEIWRNQFAIMFSKELVVWVDSLFEKFYQKLINYNDNEEYKNVLLNMQETFNLYCYHYIIRNVVMNGRLKQISEKKDFTERDHEKKKVVWDCLHDLFFFAGITFDVLDSNVAVVQSEYDLLEGDYKGVNRELSIAHNKIKKKSSSKKQKAQAELDFYEIAIPKFKNEVLRRAEECRFNNGKINFSKLGKFFGKDHKTIKSWCIKYGVKFNILE